MVSVVSMAERVECTMEGKDTILR